MGKGKLGPDGYEVSDNNEAEVGAVGEQNAAYRKLKAQCDILKAENAGFKVENDKLEAELADAMAKSGGIKEVATKDERENAILAVLGCLDHKNEEHWTEAGLPRIEAICAVMDDDTVTRAEVEAALPGYIRSGG